MHHKKCRSPAAGHAPLGMMVLAADLPHRVAFDGMGYLGQLFR
jgi:hypothetical protein